MRVGSLDAPKIATEEGARSADRGCGAVICGAIVLERGRRPASNGETEVGASLGHAMHPFPTLGTHNRRLWVTDDRGDTGRRGVDGRQEPGYQRPQVGQPVAPRSQDND